MLVFLLYNEYHIYLLLKKIDKILTDFGDPLCKSRFFIARDVQLDNGMHPPGFEVPLRPLSMCFRCNGIDPIIFSNVVVSLMVACGVIFR